MRVLCVCVFWLAWTAHRVQAKPARIPLPWECALVNSRPKDAWRWTTVAATIQVAQEKHHAPERQWPWPCDQGERVMRQCNLTASAAWKPFVGCVLQWLHTYPYRPAAPIRVPVPWLTSLWPRALGTTPWRRAERLSRHWTREWTRRASPSSGVVRVSWTRAPTPTPTSSSVDTSIDDPDRTQAPTAIPTHTPTQAPTLAPSPAPTSAWCHRTRRKGHERCRGDSPRVSRFHSLLRCQHERACTRRFGEYRWLCTCVRVA